MEQPVVVAAEDVQPQDEDDSRVWEKCPLNFPQRRLSSPFTVWIVKTRGKKTSKMRATHCPFITPNGHRFDNLS